jgi:hypothetical protein
VDVARAHIAAGHCRHGWHDAQITALLAQMATLERDFAFCVDEFKRERETTATLAARLAALTAVLGRARNDLVNLSTQSGHRARACQSCLETLRIVDAALWPDATVAEAEAPK